MFESMSMAPADPVLGLSKIYKDDTRKNKINLGIGVYIDKLTEAPVLDSVKHAEELILKKEISKNYLNIEGIREFNYFTQLLLFGSNNSIIEKNRIRTVQAPGGTGALRIIAESIARNNYDINRRKIWISDPSWINHRNIFHAAGLEVYTYPYYDKLKHTINFDELFDTLNLLQYNDIVLLHCCCHNPTGMDLNKSQWLALAECSEKNGWIPLFDLAYQGFGNDLYSDLQGLHIFCKKNPEIIVCNSYSKNFGLYNERVGACTIIARNSNNAECALSQMRSTIRANYSNPPSHGALTVLTILKNPMLKRLWEKELENMRLYIKNMRFLLTDTLNSYNKKIKQDFGFIMNQRGMFAYIGLNTKQVIKLREQSGIYLVDSGRINLAGLSKNNIDYVCESINKIFFN